MPAFETTGQARDIQRLGRIRLTTVCTFVFALSVSVFGAYRALTLTSASSASPKGVTIQTREIGDSAHAPEFLLTKAVGPPFQTALTPIEELQVGQRVRADAPTDDVDRQFGDEVVPSEWRKLTLTAPKRDGTVADVVLLRPRWWIEQQQAEVDGQVFISVPECGIDGDATVNGIDPCPKIISGPGRVITGTFRHRVSGGIELSVEGEDEPIRCTGNHPFWSEDQQDFVRADSFNPRDRVRTTNSLSRVEFVRLTKGETYVYNVETQGTHVFHVGSLGITVHNGTPCPQADPSRFVFRELSVADRARLERQMDLLAKGEGGKIADQVAGEATRYISAAETAAATSRFRGGNGLVMIDIKKAIEGGAGFVDHKNVLQAVKRDGLPKHVQNASRALEVLFKDKIPFDAIIPLF